MYHKIIVYLIGYNIVKLVYHNPKWNNIFELMVVGLKMRKEGVCSLSIIGYTVTSNIGQLCKYISLYILTLEASRTFTELHNYIVYFLY